MARLMRVDELASEIPIYLLLLGAEGGMNCRNGPCVSYSKSFLGREVPSARSRRALSAVSFGERVELFAGLEAHSFAGCDADLGACAGVAANPSFAGADAEDAKPAQFDALTCRQSFFQPFEDRIHRSFRFGAGQPCALDHVMNDVLLNQSGYLAGATMAFPGSPCRFSFRSRPPLPAGRVDLAVLILGCIGPGHARRRLYHAVLS